MDPEANDFPFITRKMLSFEGTGTFGLSVDVVSRAASDIKLTGFTKESPFVYKFRPVSTSTRETFNFSLTDLPIAVSLISALGDFVAGDAFASVYLTINGARVQQLMRGDMGGFDGLSWPQPSGNPTGFEAFSSVTAVSDDPAAGAEISITIPTAETWVLQAASVQLITAATAGSRRVHLVLDPEASGGTLHFFGTTDQIISETKRYNFVASATSSSLTDNNQIIVPIAQNLILPGASTIKTVTTNLAAGDDFGVMRLLINRYLSP